MVTTSTPSVKEVAEVLAPSPGDIQLFVVPAGDGESPNGRWRVTAQHGSTVHSGYVVLDSGKSRAEYVQSLATRLAVDADDIAWWVDRDIRGIAERYTYDQASAAAAGETAPVVYLTVEPGTVVKATDKGENYGDVVADNGQSCTVHFVSPEGQEATKEIDKQYLALQDGTPLVSGGDKASDFPPVLTFRELSERYPKLQPEVIHGVARQGEQIDDCRESIQRALLTHPDHKDTLARIKERSGRKGKFFDVAFGELIREGQLRECKIIRANKQEYDGYELSLGNSATVTRQPAE